MKYQGRAARFYSVLANILKVGFVTLVGTLTISTPTYAPQVSAEIVSASPGETGEPINNQSGESEKLLANHLTKIGAKVYGAWWCPHCHAQKELFGRQAWQAINYIECDSRGVDPQPELCQAEGVQGYPTWKINGRSFAGRQSLKALANASGYTGPRDFRNKI